MIKKNNRGGDDEQSEKDSRCGRGRIRDHDGRQRGAQEVKHYRFAYDQPKTTGYGILGDIFADKLKELSKGTMLIDQYPGAQLGQEPQVLQLVKSGDVDFCISSSANAATLSPQAGVMSMHFLFRSEAHLDQGDRRSRSVQGRQGDDRGYRAGRPRHRALDARAFATCIPSARSRTSTT